ncbi:MAG TPA: alpha-L-rhamnosidase N-terminal domain-containing protein, partial [Gemmatimonadales bacterium]|nr:alpha-L-rhamnosidase N-terminal domain-containing protein [Gemmatimonadales bacterium]
MLSLLLAVPAPRSPARATALEVEHLTTPLGIDAVQPRFSWQVSDARPGARQSAYQILVATTPGRLALGHTDAWTSGEVRSAATIDIPYGGRTLAPRTRYYWTVCIKDRDGRAAPCAPATWFETGMMATAWRAQWIAANRAMLDTLPHDPLDGDTTSTDGRPPLLRKALDLKAMPVRARIYATALGSYRLTINGRPASRAVFTPDWTDYRDRVTYQTYDVTSLVHRGPNALGVLLGAGWYASRFGFSSKRYAYGPPPVRLLLELHLTYADGHEDVVTSDSSWRTAPSPVLLSEIYDGE